MVTGYNVHWSVLDISNHFEYHEKWLYTFEVTWQTAKEDLTGYI